MQSVTFTNVFRHVLLSLVFSVLLTRFSACTAQLNDGELGMPIQSSVVHEAKTPQVESELSTDAEIETERTKRLIELLEDRFRRASNMIPVLDQLSGIEEEQRMMDPRRIKRYQRYGRARIGGTIVMGK